jgi:hypothetical protein
MRTILILAAIVAASFLTSSCEKEYFKPMPAADIPSEVSYAQHVEPMLETKCAIGGCHNGAVPPNLVKGKSYVALVEGGFVDTLNAEQSVLIVKVKSNMPPPSGLPAADIDLLVKWMKQGAKEN